MAPQEFYEFSRTSGLIAHLYDAAIDDALWPGTANRIAETLGSTSTVLKLHGEGARVNLLECTDNLMVSEREQAWADDWHRKDLWVERSVAYGMERIITDEDLVTREEQARSGFYQEWLRHLDIHHMLGAVFPAADGAIGVLGVHRPCEAGPYSVAERQQVALVLPHLQQALRLGQRFAAVSQAHAASLQALDKLDTGVLMVDGTGRVIQASSMAERLLRENAEMAVVGGRLALRTPAQHNKLLSLVRGAVDTARGRIAEPGVTLSIPRPHRMPLALEVAPLREAVSTFGAQRPAVLVFIRDPEAPISVARLRELFGLTRTEGVVAAALGQGASLEEIAATIGIGLATVRSHLKRILAKTSTHRQAEATALLARSVSTVSDQ
ncbi:helix-turn-helix transcriptional regulator [Phenylobacterium kunshanense]|uniref:Helix-turn-helix transcriptional regulator n=2 Tax=Phenylobacterium TaxID=20 RepID=A0A328BLS1_9CAUL|nr:helix-turn-helix transcriptional regulator [Phenylobacterium kunshanense]OHB26328.1 MAG: helix-turn-helix transcriptional regulator [Phenylobacterium sp. RIFCSPHIGHO2_01_FULL_69_31]PZQ59430.1 MAG: helix-turn-helix transcriptional regulator [Phenylobacterium zucineum]RAK67917.1 helix-turn-helix transcriptional regulator [Phenylobacterium kunshanense]